MAGKNRDDGKTSARVSAAYEREIAEKREAHWQALLRAEAAAVTTDEYPSAEEIRKATFALRRGE